MHLMNQYHPFLVTASLLLQLRPAVIPVWANPVDWTDIVPINSPTNPADPQEYLVTPPREGPRGNGHQEYSECVAGVCVDSTLRNYNHVIDSLGLDSFLLAD